MNNIVDYQIIQRDENGFGTAKFWGKIPENLSGFKGIYSRVVREDDNYSIVDWTECEVNGNDWEITLKIIQGGLYRFETVALMPDSISKDWAKTIHLVRHIGVGDIYVIAGQSNMAGYGRDVSNDPTCIGVHLYANDGNWKIAAHPLNDDFNSIYPENYEDCHTGTSPALSFARNLKNRIGVPVGLVQSSKGGSPIAHWHPKYEPILYNALLRRIDVVGSVKGIIWYQGCSETMLSLSEQYFEDFKTMVECWRKDLGNVYFLTVQLNRWTNPTTDERDSHWGNVKEAQRRAGYEIEGVSVISSHDLSVNDGIHNNSAANVIIGERLCNAALNNIYGISAPIAPNIQKVKTVDSTHLIAIFDHNDIVPMDNVAEGIYVIDKNGKAECVMAEELGDGTILLTTEREISLPATLSAYCDCTPPAYILKQRTGLPILAFKDFEIDRG